jgi:N-acetyl-gamma-glutamylphosphate reductase
MELDTKIVNLFKAKDVAPKPIDTNSVLELKTIENQLNIHLKNKQGLKFKKVSIAYDKAYNEEKFTQVIDDEINIKIINKKWKSLPMYLKWKYIEDYLKLTNNIDTSYIAKLKMQLMNNSLEVEYEDKKILKII